MNWFVIGAVCIAYPLFGIAIYIIRNRLTNIKDFSYVIMAPIFLSFIIGIGILGYAITTM